MLVVMLVRWVLFALALLFTGWLVPGITFAGFNSALLAALVMGLVNIFIRPLFLLLTLPLNFLTLGLFTFVINALMFLLVAKMVPGFDVNGFWTALLGSIVMSVLSFFISGIEF